MDDIAKQIADLNRSIEKLIRLLSSPTAVGGGGLHVYVHQVPPIMSEKPAYGTASDPRWPHSTSFTAPGRRTQAQTY